LSRLLILALLRLSDFLRPPEHFLGYCGVHVRCRVVLQLIVVLLHYRQLVLERVDPALAVLAVLREVLLDLLEHPLRLREFLLRQLLGLLAHSQLLLYLL